MQHDVTIREYTTLKAQIGSLVTVVFSALFINHLTYLPAYPPTLELLACRVV